MAQDDPIKKTPRFFATVRNDEVFYGTTTAFRFDGFFPATVFSKSAPQGQPWQLSRADIDLFLLPHQFEHCIKDFPHTPSDIAAITDDEVTRHISAHPPQTQIDRIRELETIQGRLNSLQQVGNQHVGVLNPGFGPPRTFPATEQLRSLVGSVITVRQEKGHFYVNDNVLAKQHAAPAAPAKPPPTPSRVEPCFS